MTKNTEQNTPKVEETLQAYHVPPAVLLVDKVIADAERLQEEGKIGEAIEKWRSLANVVEGSDDKGAARALVSVSKLLLENEEVWADAPLRSESATDALNQALSACDKAICLVPTYAAAWTQRGLVKRLLGQYTEAIADCDEAIRLNPEDAYAYTCRGLAKTLLGQSGAAIEDFDAALRLDATLAEAYYYRALAKFMMPNKDRESILADYDEAIRFAPGNAVAHVSRGLAKESLLQYDAAVADYEEAMRLNPREAWAYTYRGQIRWSQGRYAEAKQDYETALQLAREAGDAQHQSYVESELRTFDSDEEEY